jgi:hypothetical protein
MTIKNDSCELEVEKLANAHGRSTYQVKLLSGEWPKDIYLITICDNGNFKDRAYHFGGKVVEIFKDTKCVTVYTD